MKVLCFIFFIRFIKSEQRILAIKCTKRKYIIKSQVASKTSLRDYPKIEFEGGEHKSLICVNFLA